MRLMWQIARKDLRRFRAGIACWAGLQAFTLLVAEPFGLHPNDFLWGIHFAAVLVGGLGVYLLAGLMLVDDPMGDPRAFWKTRPISAARLLVAKFLGCCLMFGLLPLALRALWWKYYGYGARELGWGSVETLAGHALIVAAAFGMASLGPSMRGFLRWSVGAVPVALGGLILLMVAMSGRLWEVQWRLLFVAGAVVFLMTGLCVSFFHRRILALSIAGCGLTVVVVFAVPRRERGPFVAGSAKPEVGSTVAVAMQVVPQPPDDSLTSMVVKLRTDASAQREFATLVHVRGVLQPAGAYPQEFGAITAEPELLSLLEHIVRGGTSPGPRTSLLSLRSKVSPGLGLAVGNPTNSLTFVSRLWTVVDAIEVPLRIEASTLQGNHRITVKAVDHAQRRYERLVRLPGATEVTIMRGGGSGGSALEVELRETFPLLAVDGAELTVENNGRLKDTEVRYFLVNRRRDEIISIEYGSSGVRSATLGIRQVYLTLPQAPGDAEAFRMWTFDASVVKIVLRRTGEFARTVEVAP